MADTSYEHQFCCSICLELFTDPVSTPCGHNFCKVCIEKYWDTTELCSCPLCKEVFHKRPELRINISFRDVLNHFKDTASYAVPSDDASVAVASDVACDVCTDVKLKAAKSCLVCMASYCEAHLKPHKTAAALSKHKLIEPSGKLEDRICQKHEKILELFCRKEEVFICQICAETDHRRHLVVTQNVATQQKMVIICFSLVFLHTRWNCRTKLLWMDYRLACSIFISRKSGIRMNLISLANVYKDNLFSLIENIMIRELN